MALQRMGLSKETGDMEEKIAKMEKSMAHQQSKLDQTNKQIAGAESLLAETGGSSEQMVASVTAEIKVQVDKTEALAPTIVPLQTEIAMLNSKSSALQAEIADMKAQVATNKTDRASKEDTIANTSNDIKILKENIEAKKQEIDPLPGAIEEAVDETERLSGLIADYQAKHGGMRSADFTSVKSSGKGGFTSVNQNGTKAKSKK